MIFFLRFFVLKGFHIWNIFLCIRRKCVSYWVKYLKKSLKQEIRFMIFIVLRVLRNAFKKTIKTVLQSRTKCLDLSKKMKQNWIGLQIFHICFCAIFTVQKKKFSIKDFFSKWLNPPFPADLVTFTEEIFNAKLHFLCSVLAATTNITILKGELGSVPT